jgi:hypothetical protein
MTTNVLRAKRDVERLQPFLKMILESSNVRQREAAAKLKHPDPTFQEGTSKALFEFLIASVAAAHRTSRVDRKFMMLEVKRRRAATRKIAAACALWKSDDLPDDLWREYLISIWHKNFAERSLARIEKLKVGRPPFRAFDKFVLTLADRYKRATGQDAIVKFNNAREPRCYGDFADLIEESYGQAIQVLNASGLRSRLAAPTDKAGRLDHARKVIQRGRIALAQRIDQGKILEPACNRDKF